MTAINFPANPSNGDTHQGFVYNSTLGVWQSAGTQTAVTSFTGLSDTPSTLGTAGQIAKVNSGATALEFADQSGVTVYANVDALPGTGNTGDLAFVTATNRLYLWNGSGWYNIALINTTPSISGVNSSYALASDGTATVITITAVDPEGLPITYSIASDTSGNIATVTQGTGASTNVFTITPSTNTANGGTFSLTFRASDGVNIASSIASFTLEFIIQNSNYTTALITSVGANNAVNNTFVDSSTNSHTITATGNVTQNTFSPYREGGYSTYLDGTGDFLSIADHSSFELGSGDFTIETWFYLTALPFNHGGYYAGGICGKDDSTTRSYSFTVQCNGSSYTGLSAGLFTGPSTIHNLTYTGTINQNQWYHVAVSRESGTGKLFLDGQVVATLSGWNHTPTEGTQPLVVGAGSSYPNYEYRFPGYLKDFRFVKGTAVYTSTFTPPTERLTAITNTSLLTCHLPYIADGSTNGHSITVNGDTKTEPFAPYDSVVSYSTSDNGGSMYFDGSSRLEAADSADWNQDTDFTIEAWFYPKSIPGQYVHMFGQWQSGGGGNRNTQLTLDPNGRVFMTVNRSGTNYSTPLGTTLKINNWYHIAVTLSGTTLTVWVNGKNDGSTTVGGSSNDSSMGWAIGGEPGSGSYPFTGNIAETRVIKGTALYTAAFTPPTAPLTAITNTKLLLSGTNAGIIDKSQSVEALTLYGDAKSSTTQSKYLSSSLAFDGTGDYIQSPYNAGLFNRITFPSGVDFTVEAWIYMNTAHSVNHSPLIVGAGDGVDASPAHYFNWGFYFSTGGTTLNFGKYDGSTFTGYSKTHSISATTWTHVAVTRNGTDLKFFVDGTQLGTTETDSTNWSGIANYPLSIGRWYHSGGTADDLDGYLSDIRITKGLARYTANFTPPTAALRG